MSKTTSRPSVEQLPVLAKAAKDAEEEFMTALQLCYPIGTYVRVEHHRGLYYGYVTGWDWQHRILVENAESFKVSLRSYKDVSRVN